MRSVPFWAKPQESRGGSYVAESSNALLKALRRVLTSAAMKGSHLSVKERAAYRNLEDVVAQTRALGAEHAQALDGKADL